MCISFLVFLKQEGKNYAHAFSYFFLQMALSLHKNDIKESPQKYDGFEYTTTTNKKKLHLQLRWKSHDSSKLTLTAKKSNTYFEKKVTYM